jgi:hypothetical protein
LRRFPGGVDVFHALQIGGGHGTDFHGAKDIAPLPCPPKLSEEDGLNRHDAKTPRPGVEFLGVLAVQYPSGEGRL